MTTKNKLIGAGLEYHYAITGDKVEAIDKLAQLEDIMEKYGIESVEELDKKLKDISLVINKFLNDCRTIQHDRDTWKKACELACEAICKDDHCEYCTYNHSVCDGKRCLNGRMDYFYTQAQKERKDVQD